MFSIIRKINWCGLSHNKNVLVLGVAGANHLARVGVGTHNEWIHGQRGGFRAVSEYLALFLTCGEENDLSVSVPTAKIVWLRAARMHSMWVFPTTRKHWLWVFRDQNLLVAGFSMISNITGFLPPESTGCGFWVRQERTTSIARAGVRTYERIHTYRGLVPSTVSEDLMPV